MELCLMHEPYANVRALSLPLYTGADLHFPISHSGRSLIKNSTYGNTKLE